MCCNEYLLAKKLPKYELANNLYIGDQPDFLKQLTIIEQSLIARYRIKCTIVKIMSSSVFVNNTAQLKICGNIITYPQDLDSLLTLLPLMPSCEMIHITFVGKIRPPQNYINKLFTVRRELIHKSLVWLKMNNELYKDVIISNSIINQLPVNDIPLSISNNFIYRVGK